MKNLPFKIGVSFVRSDDTCGDAAWFDSPAGDGTVEAQCDLFGPKPCCNNAVGFFTGGAECKAAADCGSSGTNFKG